MKLISEEYINKLLSSHYYCSKEKVLEEIKDLNEDTSLDSIYKKYKESKILIEHAIENRKNCKSDYSYWSFVGEEETYTVLSMIYATIIFNKLDVEDLPIYNDIIKSKELDKLKSRINDNIEGLSRYKPTGYKSQIEILKDCLNNK